MRKIVIILISLLFFSCSTTPDYARKEILLTNAVKPITVVSISRDNARYCSILFIDAKGRLFSVDSEALGSLKPGDQITKNGAIFQ